MDAALTQVAESALALALAPAPAPAAAPHQSLLGLTFGYCSGTVMAAVLVVIL